MTARLALARRALVTYFVLTQVLTELAKKLGLHKSLLQNNQSEWDFSLREAKRERCGLPFLA